MIRHHPHLGLISDYAKGMLPSGMALTVSCHLENCASCDAQAAAWESIGGALLGSVEPVALAPDALARTIARIGGARPRAAKEPPSFLRRFLLPKPLRGQQIGARHWLSPNIWFAPIFFPAESGTLTYLIYARKNTVISEHTHPGAELTVVLHGSFRDDEGTFRAGDFAQSDQHTVHAPTATDEGECLCLISADGPMQFASMAARIVQALAGKLY